MNRPGVLCTINYSYKGRVLTRCS